MERWKRIGAVLESRHRKPGRFSRSEVSICACVGRQGQRRGLSRSCRSIPVRDRHELALQRGGNVVGDDLAGEGIGCQAVGERRVDSHEAAIAGLAEERRVPVEGVGAEAEPRCEARADTEDAGQLDEDTRAGDFEDELALLSPCWDRAGLGGSEIGELAARGVGAGENARLAVRMGSRRLSSKSDSAARYNSRALMPARCNSEVLSEQVISRRRKRERRSSGMPRRKWKMRLRWTTLRRRRAKAVPFVATGRANRFAGPERAEEPL